MILVFGAGGQVGRALAEAGGRAGLPVAGYDRAAADIADKEAVARAMAAARPRLIVNAAAYTAVDQAETEPEAAYRCNAAGPVVLADAAAAAGVPLVHISTDYVFDGTKAGPYDEDDPPAPLGVYGRTKLAGEIAVRERLPDHLILRTAWVYGRHGRNFLKTMLRLAAERDTLAVVVDQIGTPTAADDIAAAILAVAADMMAGRGPRGTFHLAGAETTSWHGFASAIVDLQAPATGRHPPVRAITTADYPTPARRPANSVLSSDRFAAATGFRARSYRIAAAEIIRQLLREHVR